jgi:hypothetical protein
MGPVPVVQQPEHGKARRTAEVIDANQVLPATPRPDEYDFAHFRERLPAPVPKFVDLSAINAEADSAVTGLFMYSSNLSHLI